MINLKFSILYEIWIYNIKTLLNPDIDILYMVLDENGNKFQSIEDAKEWNDRRGNTYTIVEYKVKNASNVTIL